MGVNKIGDDWFSRKQAAVFLTELGFPCTARHLEHLAARKQGPPYTKTGWCMVWYHRDKLRSWFEANVKEVPA